MSTSSPQSPGTKEKHAKRAHDYYKAEKYELKKKKQNEELWDKVKGSDDLHKIVELKHKIERTKKARLKLTSDIKDMKKALEGVKTSISNFVDEQTSSFNKKSIIPKDTKGKSGVKPSNK